jgi:hypothetical protein
MVAVLLARVGAPLADLDWSYCAYIFGATTAAWVVVFQWVAYDSPQQHPHISPYEHKYIIASLAKARDHFLFSDFRG